MKENKLLKILAKFFGQNAELKVYKFLRWALVIAGLLIILGILFPTAMTIFWNILWVILFFFVLMFFGLGLLTILGMKNEVSKILDLLLEGGMSFIDFLDFIKDVWKKFVELLLEFLLLAAWILAYIVCGIIYILILLLYKSVGSHYDVTLMTIGITILMVAAFGIISKPKVYVEAANVWAAKFKKRFRQGMIDGLEIVLFVFFLTIDSTNLFFLPQELNIPLRAEFGDQDLMVKSMDYHTNFKFTLTLLILATTFEVIRNMLRVVAWARFYYAKDMFENPEAPFMQLLKGSLRKSFNDMKNDLIKFITFTTVLFFVFMFFPKLKLFTLLLASVTNLALDLFISERLTAPRGEDLISRTIAWVFRL